MFSWNCTKRRYYICIICDINLLCSRDKYKLLADKFVAAFDVIAEWVHSDPDTLLNRVCTNKINLPSCIPLGVRHVNLSPRLTLWLVERGAYLQREVCVILKAWWWVFPLIHQEGNRDVESESTASRTVTSIKLVQALKVSKGQDSWQFSLLNGEKVEGWFCHMHKENWWLEIKYMYFRIENKALILSSNGYLFLKCFKDICLA